MSLLKEGFCSRSHKSQRGLAHVRHKSELATPPDANYVCPAKAKDAPQAQDMLRLRRVVVAGGRQRAEQSKKKNESFDVELISNTRRSIGGGRGQRGGGIGSGRGGERKGEVAGQPRQLPGGLNGNGNDAREELLAVPSRSGGGKQGQAVGASQREARTVEQLSSAPTWTWHKIVSPKWQIHQK